MRPPSRLEGAPVVKWLLIVNIAVFLIDALYTPNHQPGQYVPGPVKEAGVYTIQQGLYGFQVWRLISFQFLHFGWLHILFNLYAIYMFGGYVERFWRSRPFIVFYLLCGIGGAMLFTLLAWTGILPDPEFGPPMTQVHLMGASAGVFGILVATAVIAPEGRVMLLIPPIPMKMRTFAIVFIVIETFIVLTNGNNAGGSAGHLGGAAVGFVFMTVKPLRSLLMALANTSVKITRPSTAKPAKTAKVKPKRRYEKKLRPKSRVSEADANEIDRILDKINSEGLQSLTEEERELLTRAGGKK